MLVVVLACFAAGLAAQRWTPRARELVPTLDRLVIWVTVPALVLARLPDLELGADLAVPVGAAWASIALAAVAIRAIGRWRRWPRRTLGALLLVTPLGNTTFLGLPMVDALLGDAALTRALAYDQLGTFLGLATYGSAVAARYGAGEAGWRPALGRLVRFPPFVAVLASFVVRATGLPDALDDVLRGIGQLVSPLAMLALGLRFRVVATAAARRAAAWALGVKMALAPAVVLGVAALAGGLDDPAWAASVLEAGMPPMVTAGVVAAGAGLDEEVATTAIGVGLVLAVATVPLLALVL